MKTSPPPSLLAALVTAAGPGVYAAQVNPTEQDRDSLSRSTPAGLLVLRRARFWPPTSISRINLHTPTCLWTPVPSATAWAWTRPTNSPMASR